MYVYGKNVVKEMLKDNTPIKKAFLYKNSSHLEIIEELKNKKIEIQYLEKKELDKIVEGNHQGIILSVPDYEYSSFDDIMNDSRELIIILDHIEDPHNFGAIIRTCEAADVSGIIIPKDRSVEVNSTVIRVSTGAINHVKIAQVTNLFTTIKELKKEGFWVVGTDMTGTPYTEIDYHGKIAIIIGNEGKGMSHLIKENSDFMAMIPMFGSTNSLNASVAAGIVIFEAIQTRR